MRNIGIITNRDKDKTLTYTNQLIESIKKHGGQPILPTLSPTFNLDAIETETQEICKKCDLIICLGGDGTLLRTARTAYLHGLPVLGINLGSLGFLADIEIGEIDKYVQKIFSNSFYIEERMMLSLKVYSSGNLIAEECAINDIVISRGAIPRLLNLNVFIDDNFYDMFPGDGIAISTPTGSTAYSLSAGGPIVMPDSRIFIITPICPHILHSRSFITPENSSIKISVAEGYEHTALVSIDGQKNYNIAVDGCLEIEKANSKIKILKFDSKNFFTVLRNKIYNRKED